MKWYTDRLKVLENEAPILSACGDDCAVCPRFLARTEEELRETALFWYPAGWRDRVVGNDEIRCTGCGCRPTCSFMLLPCARDHGVIACRDCPEFECDKVRNTYGGGPLPLRGDLPGRGVQGRRRAGDVVFRYRSNEHKTDGGKCILPAVFCKSPVDVWTQTDLCVQWFPGVEG